MELLEAVAFHIQTVEHHISHRVCCFVHLYNVGNDHIFSKGWPVSIGVFADIITWYSLCTFVGCWGMLSCIPSCRWPATMFCSIHLCEAVGYDGLKPSSTQDSFYGTPKERLSRLYSCHALTRAIIRLCQKQIQIPPSGPHRKAILSQI